MAVWCRQQLSSLRYPGSPGCVIRRCAFTTAALLPAPEALRWIEGYRLQRDRLPLHAHPLRAFRVVAGCPCTPRRVQGVPPPSCMQWHVPNAPLCDRRRAGSQRSCEAESRPLPSAVQNENRRVCCCTSGSACYDIGSCSAVPLRGSAQAQETTGRVCPAPHRNWPASPCSGSLSCLLSCSCKWAPGASRPSRVHVNVLLFGFRRSAPVQSGPHYASAHPRRHPYALFVPGVIVWNIQASNTCGCLVSDPVERPKGCLHRCSRSSRHDFTERSLVAIFRSARTLPGSLGIRRGQPRRALSHPECWHRLAFTVTIS